MTSILSDDLENPLIGGYLRRLINKNNDINFEVAVIIEDYYDQINYVSNWSETCKTDTLKLINKYTVISNDNGWIRFDKSLPKGYESVVTINIDKSSIKNNVTYGIVIMNKSMENEVNFYHISKIRKILPSNLMYINANYQSFKIKMVIDYTCYLDDNRLKILIAKVDKFGNWDNHLDRHITTKKGFNYYPFVALNSGDKAVIDFKYSIPKHKSKDYELETYG